MGWNCQREGSVKCPLMTMQIARNTMTCYGFKISFNELLYTSYKSFATEMRSTCRGPLEPTLLVASSLFVSKLWSAHALWFFSDHWNCFTNNRNLGLQELSLVLAMLDFLSFIWRSRSVCEAHFKLSTSWILFFFWISIEWQFCQGHFWTSSAEIETTWRLALPKVCTQV